MRRLARRETSSARKRLKTLAVVAGLALVAVGASVATSSQITVAPVSNSAPSISGTTTVGNTLTANNGTWSGSTPLSFQYQWLRCDSGGANCHAISAATSQTYQLQTADAGTTTRVEVIAANSDGSSNATSDATVAITAASAPSPSAPPTISGTAAVGSTLSAAEGTWNGSAPLTYAYQWQRCDTSGNNCQAISGAASQTYALQAADAGTTLRVQVTATNGAGGVNATSAQTATITQAASPTGCPSVAAGQTVPVSSVAAPSRLQLAETSSSGLITAQTQSFSVSFHVTDTCGQAVSGAQLYATAVPYRQFSIPALQTTDANGNVTLEFSRLAGFPTSQSQQLLVMFVRATRPGDPVLAGISTRRLISLPVRLH